jgi:hypothetical protein
LFAIATCQLTGKQVLGIGVIFSGCKAQQAHHFGMNRRVLGKVLSR